jgi:hypothetical protein
MKRGATRKRIDQRIEESQIAAIGLIEQGCKSGPLGCRNARATSGSDLPLLPVSADW